MVILEERLKVVSINCRLLLTAFSLISCQHKTFNYGTKATEVRSFYELSSNQSFMLLIELTKHLYLCIEVFLTDFDPVLALSFHSWGACYFSSRDGVLSD